MIETKAYTSFCLQQEKLFKNHWVSVLLNSSLVVLFEDHLKFLKELWLAEDTSDNLLNQVRSRDMV